MSIMQTIISLLKVKKIPLVDRYNNGGDIHTFVFKSKDDLKWEPGQHGIFKINHKKIKKPRRPFSIASLSKENKIIVSTRIGKDPSPFKEALNELKPGMTIDLRGPIGHLYEKNTRMKILIATGIGITPYRGIIKEIRENNQSAFKLLYLSKPETFIYPEVISCESDSSIDCFTERKAFLETLDALIQSYTNDADYYIVGAPKVVKSIENIFKEKGIQSKNIRKDTFFGY